MRKNISLFLCSFVLMVSGNFCFAQDENFVNINTGAAPDIVCKKQSLYADFIDNQIFERFERYFNFSDLPDIFLNNKKPAYKVNRFDEVPDSPFFTNRNAKKILSISEIKKAANVTNGPDMQGGWTVVSGKSDGDNAGFVIKDSKGDKYLIKLDRKKYPEMNSGAEIIGSKLFYAIGYNVPQYTICYFSLEKISVSEKAEYYNKDGFKERLTKEKLAQVLKDVGCKNREGFYRASASKYLTGIPKGYVSFSSCRKADKLDQTLHKDRREMRALKVFCSWLNHHDVRRGNTLDMLIEGDNGWFLKHYLIDFGASLGSHNFEFKYPEAGHMYVVDVWEALKAFVSFGLYERPYHVDAKVISPAVGYITSEHFRPGKWKPIFPNYAFDNMTRQDAYWAAKIVMSFTDEQIKAVVDEADFSFSEDAAYLVKTIIERREAIGHYWFSQVCPVDNFELKSNGVNVILSFENLYEKYGFLDDSKHLIYEGSIYDTEEKKTIKLLTSDIKQFTFKLEGSAAYEVAIRVKGFDKNWLKPVTVTIGSDREINAIRRK